MKIKQTSDNELHITKGAWPGRIIGLVMVACLGLTPVILNANSASINGDRRVGVGILVFFALVGVATIFLSSDMKTMLRRNGQSEIAKKRLLGSAHTDTFDVSNVNAVQHSTYTDYDRTENGTVSDRKAYVNLLLTDGSTIELFSGKRFSDNFNINGMGLGSVRRAPFMKEAESIASFLGVPLQRQGELSTAEAIQAVGSMFRGNTSPNTTTNAQPQDFQNPQTSNASTPVVLTNLPKDQPGENIEPEFSNNQSNNDSLERSSAPHSTKKVPPPRIYQ